MSVRILVVDDNRETLMTYVKALRRRVRPKGSDRDFELEVEEADRVSEAVDKLRSKTFDIVVADLKLSGLSGGEMGGLELVSESLKLDPLRSVIVITGYGSVELARKTLTQGVFDFIEKSAIAVDELVTAVQRAIDRRNEKILRSGNPFRPRSGEEPPVFGGRTRELEFFEQRMHRALSTSFCEHFLVLGNWGIGKSTLLREYKKICQSRGHAASIVLLEPLPSGTPLIEAARSIVGGILRDLRYPLDRLKRISNFFDSIGISVLGTGLQLKRAPSKGELSPQAFLYDTLTRLWKDLEDKAGVVAVLLDDLDNFMGVSEIVTTLKQTLSMDSLRRSKIIVGIASTPTGWAEITSLERHHPLSRYFMSRVELDPLSEDELRETVLQSLAGTGVSFNADVITRVFEYTKGHPFEMQVLCYHLFDNQLSARVEAAVWEKSLHAGLKDLGLAIFERWFSQASEDESRVLRIISEAEIPMAVREIQAKARIGQLKVSPRNIPKYLQRLVEKRLVSKSGRGLYTTTDKMFRSYMRLRASQIEK